MMRPLPKNPVLRCLAALGSFRITIPVLVGLFLLTWLGTLYQVDNGIHMAVEKYFSSWILFQEMPAGAPPIPLPGGVTLMLLLTVNLIVGGMIRVRWHKRNIGILITHLGIIYMMIAAWVKFQWSDEGMMMVWEKETLDYYEDSYRHEVIITKPTADGIRQYRLDADSFENIGSTGHAAFANQDWPFALKFTNYHINAAVMKTREDAKGSDPASVVGEWSIRILEPHKESERNLPACVVHVDGSDVPDNQRKILLWSIAEPAPITVGDETWTIQLRSWRYELPFAIELTKFHHDTHAGTSMAKFFKSDVEVHVDEDQIPVRIEMNKPLRRDGFVLFQSNWGPQDEDNPRRYYSGFSVARNPADQWPLYSCLVITLGMLMHFCPMLVNYIKRRRKLTLSASKAGDNQADAAADAAADSDGKEPS